MKRWIPALVLVIGLWFFAQSFAASEETAVGALQAKIGQILENQEKILAQLDKIERELYIIKVRS